jgi:hypothetical protein
MVLLAYILILIIIFLCLRYFAIVLQSLLRLGMSKILNTSNKINLYQGIVSILWILSVIGFFVLDPTSRSQAYATLYMIFIGPILIFLGSLLDVLKHCSWCNRRNIVFKDGCCSVTYEHVNKDGSRNRRRSSNKQYQFYVSKYECSDCGAVSEYVSKYSDNPNQYSKTVSRYLLSPGEGERAGIDLHNVIKS